MKPMFIHVETAPSPAMEYATEIAWVDAEGNGEVHLIRPSVAWRDTMNDLLASRTKPCPADFSVRRLLAAGENLDAVAERVLRLLHHPDVRVVATNHQQVERLLGLLLAEADLPSAVEIGDVLEVYCDACKPLFQVPSGSAAVSPIVKQCELAAAAIVGDGQGALNAARELCVTWRLVTAEAITAAHPHQEVAR